jgi:endonuclease/exonuclease/phosphatase family metal-dependent hydrolase
LLILAVGLGVGLVGFGWAGLPLPPASQTQPAVEKPARLPESVATWNLQWFPGNRPEPKVLGRNLHEREVARTIRDLDADLLLVQEVVDREALARVAKDYPWRVVSNFQRAGDEDADLPVQNLAILSKVPIRDSWEVGFHNLPLTPDRPVRGFLAARLGTKKQGMTVYTVHLKSNRGGREASGLRRERAMDYLRKDWEKWGLDPDKDRILVGGDFNCSLRNPEFAKEQTIRGLLKEDWVSVTEKIPWPGAATTKPDPTGKYPASDFDHIILSPGWVKGLQGGRWKVEVIQNPKVPSDHFPVVLRMEKMEGRNSKTR